jgi:hypothetical protein
MEQDKRRKAFLKLAFLWLGILFLGSFWLTMRAGSSPVSMVVVPEVPREGEPIVATFKLNNSSSEALVMRYEFYANGELVKEGITTIAPTSSKTYQYAYNNPLKLGEQLNFMVKTQSEQGSYDKVISSPPYPPQVWSSFVSFASFSTSVMSSMSTMTYYQTAFVSDMGFNVGLICSVVLITLLIFLELSKPVVEGRTAAVLRRLMMRFSTVAWLLFIIVMGIVYTTVMMILST